MVHWTAFLVLTTNHSIHHWSHSPMGHMGGSPIRTCSASHFCTLGFSADWRAGDWTPSYTKTCSPFWGVATHINSECCSLPPHFVCVISRKPCPQRFSLVSQMEQEHSVCEDRGTGIWEHTLTQHIILNMIPTSWRGQLFLVFLLLRFWPSAKSGNNCSSSLARVYTQE